MYLGATPYSSKPLLSSTTLRVVPGWPGRSDVPLGGVAGRRWTRKGAGFRHVYSSLNKVSFRCVRLYAGLRPCAGSLSLDFAGRIRCHLLVFLVVAVLLWQEPKVTMRGSARGSINKAPCGCGDLCLQDAVTLPPLTRCGSERKRKIDGRLGDGALLRRGKCGAIVLNRSSPSVVLCRPSNSEADGRLLSVPVNRHQSLNLQRRPYVGTAAAIHGVIDPSGRFPGDGDDGRRQFPFNQSSGQGPDCFSHFLDMVRCANLQDEVVSFCILRVLLVNHCYNQCTV
jgi:hypothetical protein